MSFKEYVMSTQSRSGRFHLSLGALALGLSFAGPSAQATPLLERVEVTGSASRVDVMRTCPLIGEALAERLGKVVARERITGSYRVEFDLHAAQANNFSTARMPGEYRKALRSAVHAAACQDAAAAEKPQRFAFMLDVTMRDEALPQRVADGSNGVSLAVREIL
jgi:hypothetical protein